MKINIPDVTIVMPLRVDSPLRLENALTIINYMTKNSDAKMIVIEADSIQRGAILNSFDNLLYVYRKDDDPVFHFTRYRNEMIKIAITPIVAIWDVDVLAPLGQIYKAAERIRSMKAILALPYDGICYGVPDEICRQFRLSGDMDVLTSSQEDFFPMFGGLTCGGLFLADRGKYMKAGMENEHFYGWGPEDVERLKRITILGLPVYRVPGCLYHLWHPRGVNSGYVTQERGADGCREYLRICRSSREALINEIGTWEWIKAK